MPKRDYVDFLTRTQPLAYLITFRTYGTWLHGDERGSIDRRNYNRYGTSDMPPNKKIFTDELNELKARPMFLNGSKREIVESAIKEVCKERSYALYAVNVRTNHVHVVVAAGRKPEHVMGSFKSYATRRLRQANLLDHNVKPWSRHGSTKYLWTEDEITDAIEYVSFGQGNDLFR